MPMAGRRRVAGLSRGRVRADDSALGCGRVWSKGLARHAGVGTRGLVVSVSVVLRERFAVGVGRHRQVAPGRARRRHVRGHGAATPFRASWPRSYSNRVVTHGYRHRRSSMCTCGITPCMRVNRERERHFTAASAHPGHPTHAPPSLPRPHAAQLPASLGPHMDRGEGRSVLGRLRKGSCGGSPLTARVHTRRGEAAAANIARRAFRLWCERCVGLGGGKGRGGSSLL